MTMAIDNTPRQQHLSSLDFGTMGYSNSPQFSNPWQQSSSRASTMSMPYTSLPAPSTAAASSTGAAPTASGGSGAASGSYSSLPYGGPSDLLQHPAPDMLSGHARSSYEPTAATAGAAGAYSHAPAAHSASSYASAPAPSSYATLSAYGQSLAHQQHDQSSGRMANGCVFPPFSAPCWPGSERVSTRMPTVLTFHSNPAVSMPPGSAFDTLDGARGMVAMSQTDITPRNIYGPRADRNSTDSYGFPSTHSSSSSVSSTSGYPHYFGASGAAGAGSVDGSVTDYSSASEADVSVGPSHHGMGGASRTLPPPTGLMPPLSHAAAAAAAAAAHHHAGGGVVLPPSSHHPQLPPAPQSMMGSFNSKVSSSAQKKHKCKVCDKRFTRPSSLQTHMYSHTGEKRTFSLPQSCFIVHSGMKISGC